MFLLEELHVNEDFLLICNLGRPVQYVQKKKTIYPEWNTCFDAHLYQGRLIQLIVMERPAHLVADVSLQAAALAEKCRDGGLASIWVSSLISLSHK